MTLLSDKYLSPRMVKDTSDFPSYSNEIMKGKYTNCELLVSHKKFKAKQTKLPFWHPCWLKPTSLIIYRLLFSHLVPLLIYFLKALIK